MLHSGCVKLHQKFRDFVGLPMGLLREEIPKNRMNPRLFGSRSGEYGLESQFRIASAATSREEIGNPVYPPAQRKLAEHGIGCSCHAARQLVNSDYEKYDLLIGMDQANLRDMYRICGGDFADKMHLLLDYTDRPNQEVADPWYTDNFEATWRDVSDGCQGLLDHLMIT